LVQFPPEYVPTISNLNEGLLISMYAEKLKILPSKITLWVTFKITGHLNGCTERY
jgi:hypothetical protein